MRLIDLRTKLERDVQYPIDRDALISLLGDERLDSPKRDSDTVAAVLERGGDAGRAFASADEVFDAIIGNVDDDHIGPKFYDDRANNLQDIDPQSL